MWCFIGAAVLLVLVCAKAGFAEELPLGASSIRAHTSRGGERSNDSPAQVYAKAWTTVDVFNYDRTFNGQNWQYWQNRYNNVLVTREDAYKAIETMLASLGKNLRSTDFMRFCDYDWKWYPKGIGIQLAYRNTNQCPKVGALFANSSAAGGGELLPGDCIQCVDGVPTNGLTVSQVVDRIKGQPDTSVTLQILRGSSVKDVKVYRTWVSRALGQVSMLGENIGYIGVIDASDDRLVEETEKALLSLPKARSIILDFRSSCEQYPMTAQVVPFCNLFLEDSVVISFATANKREEKRTSAEAKFKGRLIALIDSTVGFQSEMICSALKHNNRAILVGDTTVCKPILMSRVFLVEGGSFCFNLSTGEYFQPDGSKFDTGLKPTISLPLVTSDFESGKGPWWYFNKTLTTNELKDSQLKRAIELLNDES